MPETTLAAEAGRTTGTSATRRLRADGKIPGVVYGHGTEPISVAVVARDFRIATSGEAGLNTLLSLDLDGTSLLTMARDVQRHPVKNVVTHVDFLIVRRDEVIAAEVAINLEGDAVEVHHGDGIVEQQLFTLHIRATPAAIPSSVDVDVSGLTIGSTIHVADLVVPAGVEVDTDPETPVVTGLPPRVQVAAEGAEGEEPAAAEAGADQAAEAAGGTESAEPSEG